MRILHIVLSRGFAGSERSTAESCNAQCERHDVALVLRRDHRRNGASIRDHLDPRVQCFELPRFWFTRWHLGRVLRHWRPELVHGHLRRATRLIAQLRPPCASVSTLHIGVNGPHFLQMDGLVCNARWQVRQLPKSYTGQALKDHNSLTPHRRLSAEEIAGLRASWGVQPGELLVGGVGRLTDVKGWDTLIAAVRSRPELKQLKLVLFGLGAAEARLQAQAAGDARIQLLGFRADVKDCYQAFDVFVCPSRFEPLPRVVLEAMDAGTPVITSTADGCRELVEDHGGELFAIGDVQALAALLADHVARPRARQRPDLSAHDIAVSSQVMLGFYRELLARRDRQLLTEADAELAL